MAQVRPARHLVTLPHAKGAAVNYAALLGVVAAVAFTLPLLARLAVSLGLPRDLGVAVSLLIAVIAAGIWYVRSVKARSLPSETLPVSGGGKIAGDSAGGDVEEEDASL